MTTMEQDLDLKTIRIGHTPDPDDAYMFYGFATKQVEIPGHQIEHVLEDIESLNQKALKSEIEVTAISAAVYPLLNNTYWIMPMGASVGRNYGPIVVKRKGTSPSGKTIGIPGKNTTAYLLLRLLMPDFQPVVYRFDQIPEAVQKGEIDYGLLIHEAQITYETYGFDKLHDLGTLWMDQTGFPVPLGLDVINKNMGLEMALSVAGALKRSIEVANAQRDKAVEYAQQYGRGMGHSLADRFIGMYVNDDTMDMGDDCEKGLNLLFDRAYRAGIYSKPTRVEILRP